MEYRRLGSSGLKVSAVGLGANNFGSRMEEKQSIDLVHHALDIGVNFIDTANIYGDHPVGAVHRQGHQGDPR